MSMIQLQGAFEANGKWNEEKKDSVWEALDAKKVTSAVVIGHDAEWGDRTYQIRCNCSNGKIVCLNLSKQSTLREDDAVNIKSIVMVTLSRGEGSSKETIYRYDGERAEENK